VGDSREREGEAGKLSSKLEKFVQTWGGIAIVPKSVEVGRKPPYRKRQGQLVLKNSAKGVMVWRWVKVSHQEGTGGASVLHLVEWGGAEENNS